MVFSYLSVENWTHVQMNTNLLTTAKHLKISLWFLMLTELDMSTGIQAWGRDTRLPCDP